MKGPFPSLTRSSVEQYHRWGLWVEVEGVLNLGRVNKDSQGPREGSLPRRPFHLPHRSDTAPSALTGSEGSDWG